MRTVLVLAAALASLLVATGTPNRAAAQELEETLQTAPCGPGAEGRIGVRLLPVPKVQARAALKRGGPLEADRACILDWPDIFDGARERGVDRNLRTGFESPPSPWAVSLPSGALLELTADPAFPFSAVPLTLHRRDAAVAGTDALLIGGAAVLSAVAGAFFGYQVSQQGWDGLAVGWLAGPAVVTPFVVHALNDGRSSLPLGYAAAAGIVLVSAVTIDKASVIFIASPALQAIAAPKVQRRTGPP